MHAEAMKPEVKVVKERYCEYCVRPINLHSALSKLVSMVWLVNAQRS